MNRSILIIICDFLLVTLVAFSTFEGNDRRAARGPCAGRPNPQPATRISSAR